MEQLKAIITEKGWTPQIKVRRESEKQYLYAARREGKRMIWRYIGAVPKMENLTEQEILEKLGK